MFAIIIALIAAVAYMMHWQWIMLGSSLVLAWIGWLWLIQRHPFVAIFIIGFLRGLLGGRR